MRTSAITCEIQASSPTLGDLQRIAGFCAKELGQPLEMLARECLDGEPVITLHLPVEQAATQHPAWCLACRLACFCPTARVTVLVRAAANFPGVSAAPTATVRRRHRRATRRSAA